MINNTFLNIRPGARVSPREFVNVRRSGNPAAPPRRRSWGEGISEKGGVPRNAVCFIPATEHALKLERERCLRRKPGVTIRTKDISHKRCGGDSEIALPGRRSAALPDAQWANVSVSPSPSRDLSNAFLFSPKTIMGTVHHTVIENA